MRGLFGVIVDHSQHAVAMFGDDGESVGRCGVLFILNGQIRCFQGGFYPFRCDLSGGDGGSGVVSECVGHGADLITCGSCFTWPSAVGGFRQLLKQAASTL